MKPFILLLTLAALAFPGAAAAIEPPKTYGDAMRWYQRAAEEGLADAQFLFGRVLEVGIERQRDLAQAVIWYRKAAEQGHVLAQYRLGLLYYGGRGVERDTGRAASWYLKAAEQGLAEAQFNLGLLHERGIAPGASRAGAVDWYLKAAEQGLGPAQLNLGLLLSGAGPEHEGGDPEAAWAWLSLAAESGEKGAGAALEAVAARLTPEQMTAARARLKALKSGSP